jgi:hypothetical protein
MKKLIVAILILLGNQTIKAQNSALKHIDSIKISKDSEMSTDHLGHLYLITPTNDIIKYNRDGQLVANANFKIYGKIASIDVSNPFMIFVFYRDQNKILVLDNLLNILNTIDLETANISQVGCMARSFDNQIWLYDLADLKLKKYQLDLTLIYSSAPFNLLPIKHSFQIKQILDISSAVQVLNDHQVLQFDIFGNYHNIILEDSLLSNYQFNNNIIRFYHQGKLFFYNTKLFEMTEMIVSEIPQIKNIRIEKERVYILTDEYVILQSL